MKQLRVLVLTHEDLVPPESLVGLSEREVERVKKEYDVRKALVQLGHQIEVLGVSDDLMPIRHLVEDLRPDVVFQLLMEFQDVAVYQAHVTSYLELLRVPYAGCNPRGLLLARDKALAKTIFRAHRIPTATFFVVPRGRVGRMRRGFGFPLIVKSLEEEASLGIAQASVVHDEKRLAERVEFIHDHVGTDAIVEPYIEGRELTIGVLGNERLRTLPIWELVFEKLPEGSMPIATARAKWDLAYQQRIGLNNERARDLAPELERRIARVARRAYRALGLSGYARIDLRLTPSGLPVVLEANPNPDLSHDEDIALAAGAAGLEYPALIQHIVRLGMAYRSPWKKAAAE